MVPIEKAGKNGNVRVASPESESTHLKPHACVFNPIALRTAKTLWSFGHSECNRVKWPGLQAFIHPFSLVSNRLILSIAGMITDFQTFQ